MKITLSALIIFACVASAFGASAIENVKHLAAERHSQIMSVK
jgi:hypothetical protein